jgi:hypothetical protein
VKKTIVLIGTCFGLVLLLGAIGGRPQIYDPNSQFHGTPCVESRERILKYEIVVASDPNALAKEVNNRLKEKKENWRPMGGVSVSDGTCHQAMIKLTE